MPKFYGHKMELHLFHYLCAAGIASDLITINTPTTGADTTDKLQQMQYPRQLRTKKNNQYQKHSSSSL